MDFKKFFHKWGWIIIWAIVSILVALIIHILFSIPSPHGIFDAKWGAGDILSYICTVALGLLAMWQNQKMNEENSKSQAKMEQYQKDLVIANEKANEISNMLLRMQVQNKKACFVPTYLAADNADSRTRHFGDFLDTINVSDNISIIRKTCCICNGEKIEKNDLNTFVGCKNQFSEIHFEVNPSGKRGNLVLYIFLENENSFKYVQALDIGYTTGIIGRMINYCNTHYFNTWDVPELQIESN